MPIQAIIFDLDGTLLNTLEDLAQAGNTALAAIGLPPQDTAAYCQLVGAGARNLAIRAIAASGGYPLEMVPEGLVSQFLQSFQVAYDQGWAGQTQPYAGILALLDDLKATGLKLAVLSNKPDSFTQDIVAHFFPGDYFQATAGKLEGWPIKPDPALALEICRQMAIDPGQAVLVGDSGSDMQTAVRAGMKAVGVLWGYRSARELNDNGAGWLIAAPADLPALLARGVIS